MNKSFEAEKWPQGTYSFAHGLLEGFPRSLLLFFQFHLRIAGILAVLKGRGLLKSTGFAETMATKHKPETKKHHTTSEMVPSLRKVK